MFGTKKEKKWVIVFTDMKDYTVKSSLMTNLQLTEIIDKQEEIFYKSIWKYNWKIIKSMWDWYMIFFENWIDALNSVLEIQEKLKKYNNTKKIPLFKIEVRIWMDYGTFIEKNTVLGTDLFGNSINIASRLENITPSNWIFLTENVIKNIWEKSKKYNLFSLWKKSLKWIFENIKIYELLEKNINLEEYKKNFFKNKKENKLKKQQKEINDLIFKISAIWALISTQPIPLIDIYNLLALQIYLLIEISKKYWIKLSITESKDILFNIIWIIWANYIVWQSIIWISKIGLPVIWGYLIIPLTFSITYWAWKVINTYMYYKSKNLILEEKYIKEIFSENLTKWKEIWKKEKDNIIEIWKKNKDIFINKIKEIYEKYELKNFYQKIKIFWQNSQKK